MVELTKSEKISLGTKEIAKRIRQQLKEEFPACIFSVRTQYYSGGSSIHISLMKADRKIKLRFNEISEVALCRFYDDRYTKEQLKSHQEQAYHQLGHFYDQYNANSWSNGVFLTYQGHMLLKRVEQIANQYNFDDSDSQTDYYHVNFSLHLELGQWNKPFIDGVGFKVDPDLETRIDQRLEETELARQEKEREDKLRQIEEDQLRKTRKSFIPNGATHVIDGSGLRPLTTEEKETGQSKEKLEKKWFNGSVDWKKFTLEL